MKLELAVGRKSVFSVEYGEIKGVKEISWEFLQHCYKWTFKHGNST